MNYVALSIAMLVLSCISIVVLTATNAGVKIRKFKLHFYWMIPFVCAIVLLATGAVPWSQLAGNLSNFGSNMNPLKVLILFISMSCLSVYLDQAGFFRWLASAALKHAGKSQIKLFVLLYFVIALLTIVTSNSTIILTFTPFICYFAKHSGVNPIPYLFTEFVAANTWSMFLLIGNATNTYVATSFDISFIHYIAIMAVPTVFAAITSFVILLVMFRKPLREPLSIASLDVHIKNFPALIVGVVGLVACTVLLIVSSYAKLEMWLISLISAASVMVIGSICYIAKGQGMHKIAKTLRRMPWHLVPFLLSMYVIVLALSNAGVIAKIASIFTDSNSIWAFGGLAVIVSNFMNNIPMSVLFTNVLTHLDGAALTGGIFATIIGSNIGSMLAPIASMSAIMWRSIIKHKHVRFTFFDFIKRGVFIALPTLAAALGGLVLMLTITS